MTIRLEPFRAIRLRPTEEVPLAVFLDTNADAPNVGQLLTRDKRASDRSRYVGVMRVAAALASWRRTELLISDTADRFYWWSSADSTAVAGLTDIQDLPATGAPTFETKEEKSDLEATGTMIEFPAIRCENLPARNGETIDETASGALSATTSAPDGEITPISYLAGKELVGAFRLILAERGIDRARIPVWLVAGENPPPTGLLFWRWAEEMAGAKQ